VLETFGNIFKVPELRKKIGFTALMVVIYRIGGHIPTPGIDGTVLAKIMSTYDNQLFGLFDMFVGGAMKKATIFALGIMPYISSSIIIQLLGTIYPYFQKLQRETEGRRKITQFTRYGTVILAMIQAVAISLYLQNLTDNAGNHAVISSMLGWKFIVVTVISLTTGTIFIMWLGEQITNRGIGNGISLIIFIGIVARLPQAVISQASEVLNGDTHLFSKLMLLGVVLAMTAFIVMMTQATRRIPIQTPKKVVGTKMYAGQNTVLPLRLNMAGVIPIIFASSIMYFPLMLNNFLPKTQLVDDIMKQLQPGAMGYSIIYALLIVFFTYFYTAIIFNPLDIADNLKRSGGFIPGIRPGKKTAEYLENVLTRITLPGSIFLAFIAVIPFLMIDLFDTNFFFGGTSVLIVVGVALDTLQQLESHLQMRNYEGFMKRGKLRGRRA